MFLFSHLTSAKWLIDLRGLAFGLGISDPPSVTTRDLQSFVSRVFSACYNFRFSPACINVRSLNVARLMGHRDD